MHGLKILHLAEALGGGILEFIRLLADGTAEAGHDVVVAYGRRPETPEQLDGEFDARVELVALPWTDRSPLTQARAARAIRSAVAETRPDIVHLHSSFAGGIGALALPRDVPTIFTPNAYPSMLPEVTGARRHAYRTLERFASRRATRVGAVSPSEAALAGSYVAPARVSLVENGIRELDPGRRVQRETWPPPRVIAAGRTVPQRRPAACARILSGIKDVAPVAWIGGGGGERGREGFEALRAAGITPTGWVERKVVLDELDRATAYLHWTAWDGQAFSILEAMARDVVVVASDIPPNKELLGPRQTCATESEAIALLREVVLNPAFGLELLMEQRERSILYSAERMVSQWLALYDDLAAEGESRYTAPPAMPPAASRAE